MTRSLSRARRAIVTIAVAGACFGAVAQSNVIPGVRLLGELVAFVLLTVGTCVTIFILTEPFRRRRV